MSEKPGKGKCPVPVAQKSSGSGRKPGSTADAAFNEWLQRSLHSMYDDIAGEPVPDELLRLIARDREK